MRTEAMKTTATIVMSAVLAAGPAAAGSGATEPANGTEQINGLGMDMTPEELGGWDFGEKIRDHLDGLDGSAEGVAIEAPETPRADVSDPGIPSTHRFGRSVAAIRDAGGRDVHLDVKVTEGSEVLADLTVRTRSGLPWCYNDVQTRGHVAAVDDRGSDARLEMSSFRTGFEVCVVPGTDGGDHFVSVSRRDLEGMKRFDFGGGRRFSAPEIRTVSASGYVPAGPDGEAGKFLAPGDLEVGITVSPVEKDG